MSSIQEILGKTKFTKNDLLDKCRELGIRGYSTLKKQDLVLKIELFVINNLENNDIESPPEEQILVEILDETLKGEEEEVKTKPKTRDIETQVNPDDFKTKECNASIHYHVINKDNLKHTRKQRELLLKNINNSSKYTLGDIILNEIGIDKLDKKEYMTNDCLNIICQDGDKKKLIDFNTITMDSFLQEHSYLKKINYDNIIMDMDSKFKVDEFSSPIVELSIFYARINEKYHMLETIYEFTDPPYPVLSTNEVIHNPNYFY